MFKSDALIESKSLRESVIDRTDALDKVKVLAMLPDVLHVSVEMAGNYYEVPKETIHSLIFDNREEVESDGLRILKGDELISFKEMGVIGKNTSSFTIIPRRAILRIGMLLRDSVVAQRVRNYLLNVEEIARVEAPEVIKKAVSPAWRTIHSNVKAKRDLYLLVGVSKESAIAHALTHEELESCVDLTAFKREVRTDDTETTFTPTDLGKRLEKPLSAVKMNIALEKAGLQVKNAKGNWELTDEGEPYAKLMPVAIHGGDVTVERLAIRWRQSVLAVLREDAKQ
ncbi:conserved hypothetical protein [Candidatus Desulfosporosinus infrequens]|uniref:Uncharacterized protein n=1 Tax=Candidatus Desulfosporosinus infrequens TaxID=2043169 RepID=A0A2U3KM96_9FIRM|nr:conserved hypothetical protein [Candidatus Desulfosporosinus infrequens]